MNFTECEYKFGTIHFQKQLEASNTGPNKVPYVEELRLHLQKGYPEITNLYNKIQTNDEYRSQKIKEIMSARYKSSFEKIISDKIRSSCPKLRSFRELKTRNNKFLLEGQDNVYEDTSIFHMIFTDLFSSVIVGSLDVKDSTELWYRNSENRMIARGTGEDMKKLIELRNELFQEYDLKKIIEEYKMFNASLKYDIEKEQLRASLTNLYNKIRGGKPLDGSCDLCPPKPS